MLSQDQSQLEAIAVQSLQQLYSDDDDDEIDDLDQFNKSKSPFNISAWDSPHKGISKFNTAPSERQKVCRKYSESPQKGKSTLSHLSENLQRYHQISFQLKKLQHDTLDQTTATTTMPTTTRTMPTIIASEMIDLPNQGRYHGFTSKNKAAFTTTTAGILNQKEKSVLIINNAQIIQNNSQDNSSNTKQNEYTSQNNQNENDYYAKSNDFDSSQFNSNSNEKEQHKRKLSFHKYTEQYTCKTQQSEITPFNSRKNSRQSMSKQSDMKERQQANIAISNIDLYCVEESNHQNKDFKSTFRVVWKQQSSRQSTSQSRNSSLEKVDKLKQQNTKLSNQNTEYSTIRNQSDFHFQDFLDTSTIKNVKISNNGENFISKKNQDYPKFINYKNVNQQEEQQKLKDDNAIAKSDNIIMQMNDNSEHSTQESVRRSSKSIMCKESKLTQDQENTIQNRQNTIEREDAQFIYSNVNDASSTLNQITLPAHQRLKTEQIRTKQKVNINRPVTHQSGSKANRDQESLFSDTSCYSLNMTNQQNYISQRANNFESQQQLQQQQQKQNTLSDMIPSYEIAHKSFKQYNIPVNLRTHSLNKRQFTSRKGSNTSSSDPRTNSIQSKSINDTLLFNIYKPNQVPLIQQRLNAFIQNQEDMSSKNSFIQYAQPQQNSPKSNKAIIYTPLKSQNYCKYKTQVKVVRQSSQNPKTDYCHINEGIQSLLLIPNI